MKEHLKSLIGPEVFVPYNFLGPFDADCAIWLSILLALLLKSNDEPVSMPMSEVKDTINLSKSKQKRIVRELKNSGIINVVRQGLPSFNYYGVNHDTLRLHINNKGVDCDD